jgi:glycosyltransferase involved in cell wall biosynthesis
MPAACAPTDDLSSGGHERFFRADDGAGFALSPGDRIAVCTHALPAGGAERQWVYLAAGLKELGYQPVFVTYGSIEGANGHYLADLRASAIEHFSANNVNPLKHYEEIGDMAGLLSVAKTLPGGCRTTFIKVAAAFNTIKPKAVIAQLDQPNLVFACAALLLGIKRVVASFRNYNPTNFDYLNVPWFLPVYRNVARSGAVRFTSNFRGAGDDYADWIGMDRSRVTVIPNAIDPSIFAGTERCERERLRRSAGIAPDVPLVLGAFRLSAEKGPFDFIEVARRVVDAMPAAQFIIAGAGRLHDHIQGRIQTLKLQDNVVLLGRREDIPELIAMSDLMLLTSIKEGMPNVLLEAQSGACPVVATDAGASAEIVIDGTTGYICRVGDVEALAQRSLAILGNRDLALSFGEAARQRAQRHASKRALAEGYIAALA